MTRRDRPTVLDRLAVGGLNADLVAEFRQRTLDRELAERIPDAHRKRRACDCALCEPYGPALDEVAP